MCIYRRKLKPILQKRAARSCYSLPPRRSACSTNHIRKRLGFFTSPVERLARKIRDADGFVFVTGEYNWGVQPGLKNLNDTNEPCKGSVKPKHDESTPIPDHEPPRQK